MQYHPAPLFEEAEQFLIQLRTRGRTGLQGLSCPIALGVCAGSRRILGASCRKGISVKSANSAWVLLAVVSIGLGTLLGCDTHSRSVNAAKPAAEAQPLFTPVAATLAQQKMCNEQAAKRFSENEHGTLDAYTSHYDPTVNVCYIRVNSTSAKKFVMISDVVYDAFGGRIYANYIWINSQNKKYWEVSPSTCEILIPGKPDETCKTAAEFDELTEKYFGVAK
jgi:hypothetical protein